MKRLPRGTHSVLMLALNVLLFACALFLYGRYTAVYQERLQEENLSSIASENHKSADSATAMFKSWDTKLADAVQLITRRGLPHAEALALLEDINSDAGLYFELIGSDYTGYLAQRDASGAFIPLSYTAEGYAELKAAFARAGDARGGICFAPEFTDGYTAIKYFAVCRQLPLVSENGDTEIYTLMLACKASDMLRVLNDVSEFEGLSTVLTNQDGQYIVSSNDFKSDNFYQYLYVYNDLTLDQRSAIRRDVETRGSGVLYYKNSFGQDCVFSYERMAESGWFCVTGVPLSSFRPLAMSINYAVYSVLALALLFLVDILWLRNMNRRLKVSIAREQEAGQAKTDFLSRMSHDIRTPLNGIIGMTVLAQDEPNPPKTRDYLAHIKSSGDFLLGLVNDILDMSRVESGKLELRPEPYTDEEFRRYISAVIAPLCREKGLTFRMTESGSGEGVMFDRLRLNQIFFNLLSNAVKYTPAGGLVELYWKKTSLPERRVAYDFTVRDNGIGMSEEFQKHMYESFSQEYGGATAAGAGLGLAIVWSLVKLMGGRIDVESAQGVGTTFTVHLEAALCGVQQEAPAPSDSERLRGKRVLICEDNRVNTLIAQGLLAKWGMLTDTAENGRLGVERFAASPLNTYAAVLMDIRMPEMDGLEATQHIRALKRADASLPIIAMTANAYESDVKNCLDAGMNAHMGKPIQPDMLRDMLLSYIS